MKHILLFASIALVALVSGCKKDDTPKDPTPQERIIGRWEASRAFIGATDVLIPTSTSKTELEVEFTQNGTVAFHWTNTILTTNPPIVSESTLNGVYSWNGDILTITVTNGADMRTVIGPIDISETHFLFTPTSGDTNEFISLLEADKL